MSSATIALCLAGLFSTPSPQIEVALEQFRALHGPQWRVDVDEGTGYAEFLFGGALPSAFVPNTTPEWFELARGALLATADVHGIEPSTLVEDRALLLPLGFAGTNDKFTVRFRQVIDGVPVDGGFANVLFDLRGRVLSVQTRALPGLTGFDVRASVAESEAREIARRSFVTDHGVSGELTAAPQLCIAQIERDSVRGAVLAWKVDVQRIVEGEQPLGTTFTIDARTRALVQRASSVHHFDISGTIASRATPGLSPDTGSNPTTIQPLAYTKVSSGAVSTTSDAAGNFTLVGVDAPAVITVGYDGTFNDVRNQAGSDYLATFNATANTGNQFVLNGAPTEHVTSQANVNISVNRMRDWVRAINPSDDTADFVHRAFVNVNASCNAFYSGGSITFFIAAGGCVNTAFSTVIAHEDGHWLNDRYNTGNGGDGMGEGNADVFAMYLYDDPVVGRGFCGTGCNIRTGDNLRQFCGDCCGGCAGEVHADGEVWMGAAWKIRRNLNTALGNSAGDATADALFLAWMNAYNQTTIKSVIEAQWLVLDDDDGDLDSGTPHFSAIDSAFRQQGFPGVTLAPVHIADVTNVPDTLDPIGPYTVDATVYSNTVSSIASVQLFHRTHAGTFSPVAMASIGGNVYRGVIPGPGADAKLYYYVRATNSAAQTDTLPPSSPTVSRFFNVGPTTTVFRDTFEFAQGWSVVNDPSLASGAWTRGDPIGTLLSNKQAQPENDDTLDAGPSCFFTAQGPLGGYADDADVDGGPTFLVSPPFDLAGELAELAYSYWMFNTSGANALTVELSPDGSTWFTVRSYSGGQGGWKRDAIDVGSYFAPTAGVRIRFGIADPLGNTITEAAIDDLSVRVLGAHASPAPRVFCTTKVNSAFCFPIAQFSGSPSVSGSGPFVVGASRLLTNKAGLLFYGYGSNPKPFKGGFMCPQTPVRRTATQMTGGSVGFEDCSGTLTFDMNALIRSGADPLLSVGTPVAAQYYYRDPLGTFTLGLTDAVEFTILP